MVVSRSGRPASGSREATAAPWTRVLAAALLVVLMVAYAYAAFQQWLDLGADESPGDRLESIENIRSYIDRLHRAIESDEYPPD